MDLICMVVPGTSEGIDAVAVRQLYHGSRRVGARATVRDCIERGFSEPNVLILVRFQDETNDPGPSGQTSQRLGI